jgi:putative protein kinase ArgK-like GTPase of G3E family
LTSSFGGDNLAATFSPELADLTIYVIDVAAGDKIPSKGGPGITRSDLLVINKIDLAPHVGASLEVMERDAKRMRGERPFVFTNLRVGQGLDHIARAVTATSNAIWLAKVTPIAQTDDIGMRLEQLRECADELLFPKRLAQNDRILEAARQSVASVSGDECKWNMSFRQRDCQLVDLPAGEFDIHKSRIALRILDQCPCRSGRRG